MTKFQNDLNANDAKEKLTPYILAIIIKKYGYCSPMSGVILKVPNNNAKSPIRNPNITPNLISLD